MTKIALLLSLFLAPLVAGVLGFFLGRHRFKITRALTVLSSFWVAVVGVYLASAATEPLSLRLPWITLGNFHLDFGLLYTPLAALMVVIVGAVGLAVSVFSVRYMREDVSQARYFSAISLFLFSMLGVVLCDNLLSVFVFWEMVGFCSYLLIGHFGTSTASAASRKAFLVNKIGDIAFITGIIWAFYAFGSADLSVINITPVSFPQEWLLVISGLILVGVAAKSAQWPLHIWLPDAMAGPTPVSALIHAATMVAAGIYLLCRFELLMIPMETVVLFLGVATSILAALWAFGQTDLKKVLAYSTISQLGFMAVGFGLGSSEAAFFHLTTHASFKALLFLAAGAIIDACHHEGDALRMGGLWKKMPLTFIVFLIGSLALAGFPFTSGFFSKDTILTLAAEHSPLLLGVLMFSSLLTALYMGRLIGYVFLGYPRSANAAHAKEGHMTYHIPLTVLAVAAIATGYVGLYPQFAGSYLAHGLPHHESDWAGLFVLWGLLTTAVGGALAYFYSRQPAEPLERLLKDNYADLKQGFYFDRLWENFGTYVVAPVGQFMAFIDEILVSGVLAKGSAAFVGLVGIFAKSTYRNLITYTLYWLLAGVLIFILLINR